MVDRGGCTFVKKARNAQKSGASAVLVADKLCLCSHEDCQGHSKEANVCEDKEPRMKDDGSSSDITIPSLLIFKEDADPIKETLMKNQDVTISLSFAVSKEGSRVQYGLWTIPSSFRTNNLLSSFGPTARHLGEHASFTPHEHLSDGTEIGCRGADGRNQCFSLCTNEGRYCARDPDDVLDEGVSGADVVKESLRRICIWNNYSHVDNGQKWWIYVSEFISNCFFDSDGPSENFKSKTCVSQSLVRAEIDETLIDACIKDSGGLEGNVANSLLDAALADLRKASIVSTPVATVNDIPLRGAFSSVNLFQAICTSFSDGTQPRICGVCTHCSDQSLCISEGACTGSTVSVLSSGEDGSIGLFTFFTYLLLLVVGMGTSAYWNRRRERRHVQESLRAIMVRSILSVVKAIVFAASHEFCLSLISNVGRVHTSTRSIDLLHVSS